MSAYYTEVPNPKIPAQRVSFGTSGHRGSSVLHTFNEEHIYAITQAVCDYRKAKGVDGPLFLGGDTHALSEAAFRSALEVLVANGVSVRIARNGEFTATPAVSHAILRWNAGRRSGLADTILRTAGRPKPKSRPGLKKAPTPIWTAATATSSSCICARRRDPPWWRSTTLPAPMWKICPRCWT